MINRNTELEAKYPEAIMYPEFSIPFTLSGIGECRIRVDPYEDDDYPPQAYIVNGDNQICSFKILEPYILPENSLNQVQKKELTTFLKTPIYSDFTHRYHTPYEDICILWSSANDPNDKYKFDLIAPDYTK